MSASTRCGSCVTKNKKVILTSKFHRFLSENFFHLFLVKKVFKAHERNRVKFASEKTAYFFAKHVIFLN